jgi:NCAIR mutase (PurE)-related protein
MKKDLVLERIKKFNSGELTIDEFVHELNRRFVISEFDVKIDGLREIRKGYPETVFCLRKTPDQARDAFLKIYEAHGRALATKAGPEHYEAISSAVPEAEFYPQSGIVRALGKPYEKLGYVPVIGAGTSDFPVCEEAFLTLDFLGTRSEIILDVGVAGVHRLSSVIEKLKEANAVVVVAGMEGALPSLIAGISPAPVVGVPTSVGYGVSFGGIAPLLSMLNSCAEGLAVVNIDNGFGAAVFAHMINMKAVRRDDKS